MVWTVCCLWLCLVQAGLQVLLSSSVLCWQGDTGGGSTGWWCPSLPPSLPPQPWGVSTPHSTGSRQSSDTPHHTPHTWWQIKIYIFYTLIMACIGKYIYFVCLKKINICSRKIRESGVAVRDPPFLPPAESWSHGWRETSRDIRISLSFIVKYIAVISVIHCN